MGCSEGARLLQPPTTECGCCQVQEEVRNQHPAGGQPPCRLPPCLLSHGSALPWISSSPGLLHINSTKFQLQVRLRGPVQVEQQDGGPQHRLGISYIHLGISARLLFTISALQIKSTKIQIVETDYVDLCMYTSMVEDSSMVDLYARVGVFSFSGQPMYNVEINYPADD